MIQTADQRALAIFIQRLIDGERALISTSGATWPKSPHPAGTDGRTAEVSRETYWHFLEILPPQWIGGDAFCFAEGMEPFRLFWKRKQQYFCRRLTWRQTHRICDLGGIPRDY